MTGAADEDDFTPEQIAAELQRIAARVRQGPLDPAELQQLTEAVEKLANHVLRWPVPDAALAARLIQLAEQLRNAPPKKKNGHGV